MQSLAQFKKNHKKREFRVRADSATYWCYSIDDSIKKLREIKKQHKGHTVEMELEEEHGYDGGGPSLNFYVWRKENQKEFDKRMQQEYDWYVHNEERELEIYQKMKKKLEG